MLKLKRLNTGWVLTFAALLAGGAMPCPGCGAPMALHIWPVAALLLVVRSVASRYRLDRAGPPLDEGDISIEQNDPGNPR
jgi:hypothetical protein